MSGQRGYLRYFPKEHCYPNQQDAMEKIYSALLRKEIILFEGACGTGKTLSSLAPALFVGKQLEKTVIIATNVHQQMVQFISEAKEIKRGNDVKVAVVKGKAAMCPHEVDYEECRLKRENTFELIELEKELDLKKKELKSASENYKRSKDPALIALRDALFNEIEAAEQKTRGVRERACNDLYEVLRFESEVFRQWLFADVRTPEEINEYATKKGMCGYELLKRELKHADLIICNFHHVLSAEIFATLLTWLDKEPQDVIVIFDEAHNLESAARSHSSMTITEHTIEKAIAEIEANQDQMPESRAFDLFKMLNEIIRETYNNRFKFGERERVGRIWYDMRISDPYERNDMVRGRFMRQALELGFKDEAAMQLVLSEASEFGKTLDEEYKEQYKKGLSKILKRSHIRYAADFLSSYLVLSNDYRYYPIMNVRRDPNDQIYGRLELFTCIPSNVTEPLFASVFSIILMSATLRPFDMVKATLGIKRETCELSYVTSFPPERRLTIAVDVPPLFARSRDDPHALEAVEQVLLDSIENSRGNVIIFFQSAAEARKYYSKLGDNLNVPTFLDEAGVSSHVVREAFFELGEKGGKGVLFSYLWGTLSEGVDFRDGRGRTVIIVGVGYPALNDRMNAVESAYDHSYGFGAGWDYAVQIPTIRKIRQAMGRVVRSPMDHGVRILLDGRFLSESRQRYGKFAVFEIFPPDEREELVDVQPEKVKFSLINFFQDNS
ncbi:DNA helicase, Rad3 [Methanomethylovorans hollandica DSM 15978]|uniref:DNA helicase, Rad3 n=1 Tax=Methanomethylovorans hollandica (strain DSM 15978 / NBRC 107637 / DMS1) TaxID=867904 RepID=L0KUK2_METHD|nr:ATP-dependent DNA helicase [Methanomethylovorans hollandica]AGB48355.1 DNA helicase, Rad3 [Methanomethylovorans hollandica DSM 15978]